MAVQDVEVIELARHELVAPRNAGGVEVTDELDVSSSPCRMTFPSIICMW